MRGFSALLLGLFAASAVSAEVLYTEHFDNPAGADRSLGGVKWQVANAAAVDEPLRVPAPDVANRYAVLNPGVGTGKGKPGYVWTSLSAGNLRIIRGPIKLTPAATVAELERAKFTFDAVASASTAAIYLIVQLDHGNWYLSATESPPAVVGAKKGFDAVGAPGGSTREVLFSAAASAWQKLTLAEGQPIGFEPLDKPLAEKSEVTGAGFLIRNTRTGVTVRLDSLVIDTAKPGA